MRPALGGWLVRLSFPFADIRRRRPPARAGSRLAYNWPTSERGGEPSSISGLAVGFASRWRAWKPAKTSGFVLFCRPIILLYFGLERDMCFRANVGLL